MQCAVAALTTAHGSLAGLHCTALPADADADTRCPGLPPAGSARASSAGAAPPAADTPAPTATQPQVTSPNNSTMLASGIVLQHDDEEEEVVLGEQAPAKIASAGSL